MPKQISGVPCVLGRDQVGLFRNLQRPEGNVVQVSDRGADDVKHRRLSAGNGCHANRPLSLPGTKGSGYGPTKERAFRVYNFPLALVSRYSTTKVAASHGRRIACVRQLSSVVRPES